MHLKWGTVGEGEKGMGRRRGGGSVYSQPGIRVDGNLHHDKGGIPRKKGESPRNRGRAFQATKGIIKRIGACTSNYHANRVYIVLIKDCV
jgi:hypothetical protein